MKKKPIVSEDYRRTAQFVCRFEKSEHTRERHAEHVQQGLHEFRFTISPEWLRGDWADYNPRLVAVACPHCRCAWHADFEKFVE